MFDFTVSKMLLSSQSQKYKCTCSAIILKFRILHYFLKSWNSQRKVGKCLQLCHCTCTKYLTGSGYLLDPEKNNNWFEW